MYRISAVGGSFTRDLRELLGARDLFLILLAKELRVRYQQTALGAVWVVLQPLIPALIFALVFGRFAKLPSDGSPYLAFALTGLLAYQLFSTTVSRAGTSLMRDGQLIAKVYFPRAVLPLASGAASIIDFGVGLLVAVLVTVASGVAVGWRVLAIPLVAAEALALGLGVGLIVAVLGARRRDAMIALPFVLQALLYASPILYSATLVPSEYRTLYGLNPIVGIAEGLRWALLGGDAPPASDLLPAAVAAIASVAIGLLVFTRAAPSLSDVI